MRRQFHPQNFYLFSPQPQNHKIKQNFPPFTRWSQIFVSMSIEEPVIDDLKALPEDFHINVKDLGE